MNDQHAKVELDDIEALELTEEEKEDLATVDTEAKSINYSGQDFDVDGLVRRLGNGDIKIPTFGHDDESIQAAGFQRAFVWRRPQMDKFIESILLGYPIPGVFLVKQTDNRYLVLDGQQRLLTLEFFRNGIYAGREFRLSNVASNFKGLTYKSLNDAQRRTFDNTFIQAIIVTSDGTLESLESIYKIFERLNSGGTQLTPHEIRVALYAGPFIGFLEELNTYENWRNLYGSKSPRLRDQELVLRIFGLYNCYDIYRRPLKKFLNDVVAKYRGFCSDDLTDWKDRFQLACTLIFESAGKEALRLGGTQVNSALTEVVVTALMKRLDESEGQINIENVPAAIAAIKGDKKLLEAVVRSTADESQVSTRLNKATEIFAEV